MTGNIKKYRKEGRANIKRTKLMGRKPRTIKLKAVKELNEWI